MADQLLAEYHSQALMMVLVFSAVLALAGADVQLPLMNVRQLQGLLVLELRRPS